MHANLSDEATRSKVTTLRGERRTGLGGPALVAGDRTVATTGISFERISDLLARGTN
ncbi:hypothetical protein ACQ4WX_49870 [Streptomyces lasalocidi]